MSDDKDMRGVDGLSPDEIQGPGDSVADPQRCTHENHSGDKPEECTFSALESLQEAFRAEPIPVVMAPDGLPAVVTDDPSMALAVPFTEDDMLCIADERQHVELFADEVVERGWLPADLYHHTMPSHRPKDGDCPTGNVLERYDEDGLPRPRRSFDKEQVISLFGVLYVELDDGERVPVRPIRERCRHYLRQVFNNDDQPNRKLPGSQIVFRMCNARRSNGGAVMDLMGQGVYACSLRDPLDESAEALQDSKDQKKLDRQPHKVMVPMFSVETSLSSAGLGENGDSDGGEQKEQ